MHFIFDIVLYTLPSPFVFLNINGKFYLHISYKSCNYQPEFKSKPNINIPGNRGQNEETIKMQNLLKGKKKDDWLYVRDFESSGNK